MTDIAPGARTNDPHTSHSAAGNMGRRPSMRYQLLIAYGRHPGGLTDNEAAVAAGIDPTSGACYWKRCSELRALECIAVVRDSAGKPVTRRGRFGALREVCAITDLGRGVVDNPRLVLDPPGVNGVKR